VVCTGSAGSEGTAGRVAKSNPGSLWRCYHRFWFVVSGILGFVVGVAVVGKVWSFVISRCCCYCYTWVTV
jgi:hypothetical protein